MPWRVVEALGYAYYIGKGYRVLHPLIEGHNYDFVAEKNGEYLRVNVKQAYPHHRGNAESWAVSLTRNTVKPCSKHVDVFLAYLPNAGKFMELPGDFFDEIVGHSRRIPRSYMDEFEEANGQL